MLGVFPVPALLPTEPPPPEPPFFPVFGDALSQPPPPPPVDVIVVNPEPEIEESEPLFPCYIVTGKQIGRAHV